MGTLKDSYTSFLKDIEANIKNKEDLDYIKLRFSQFLDVVLDQMDYIMDYRKEEVEKLEEKQKEFDEKMNKVEHIITHIQKDIYSDENFDFEIVCPYCDYEFVVDVDEEDRTEIECPECGNTIELDWTGDVDEHLGCNGDCCSCDGCEEDDDEIDEDEIDEDDDM